MFASFIYHLAETKYGLDGLSYLNQYANILLNIDRFFAVLSAIYILKKLINNYEQSLKFYFIGIIGIIVLLYSEKDYFFSKIDETEYLITHCIWHFAAFYSFLAIN